jgi:hypothetical protein
LPFDIDPVTFADAVTFGARAPDSLKRDLRSAVEKADNGKFSLPGPLVARIGAGDIGRGHDILSRLIADIRVCRLLERDSVGLNRRKGIP